MRTLWQIMVALSGLLALYDAAALQLNTSPPGDLSSASNGDRGPKHCVLSKKSENSTTLADLKLCEIAVRAASLDTETGRFDHVDMNTDALGYDFYIHYRKDGFLNAWAGTEVKTAHADDYHLTVEFVRQLVKHGRDPSHDPDQKFVGSCAEEDGFTTITGKPEIRLLGCAQYDPFKDAVDPDFRAPVTGSSRAD